MKKIFASTAVLLASASSALAVPNISAKVPEISALEGTAALAVVAAVVLLAWERRSRAS